MLRRTPLTRARNTSGNNFNPIDGPTRGQSVYVDLSSSPAKSQPKPRPVQKSAKAAADVTDRPMESEMPEVLEDEEVEEPDDDE